MQPRVAGRALLFVGEIVVAACGSTANAVLPSISPEAATLIIAQGTVGTAGNLSIDENGRYVPGKIAMGADVIARVGKLEARANIHVMPIRGITTAASASARGRR
jgi:hypothetical protein